MSWYSFLKNAVVRPFVTVAYGPRVVGAENIPATGGVVLACNHTSATETYLMPAMIRRQVTYPAKAELFRKGKGIKGGNQYVQLKVVMPPHVDDELAAFMEKWRQDNPYDPRGGMGV